MAARTASSTEDMAEEPRLQPETRERAKRYGLHGGMTVPLVANDASIGTLSVVDDQIRKFTDDEISLLSAFADQAALALEKARLLNEAEREKERSDALYRVSNLLAGAHDIGCQLVALTVQDQRISAALTDSHGRDTVRVHLVMGQQIVQAVAHV